MMTRVSNGRTARISAVLQGLAIALSLGSCMAFAQDRYPSKPIRMIVPFAPGGATDLAGRAASGRLSTVLGQPIIIDNRVGAAGVVGTEVVARSPADGYTLLYGASSTMLIVPVLDPRTPFDVLRDFEVVGQAAKLPLLLAASATLGVSDLKGLRALITANPPKFSYGSAGSGTGSHIAGAAFAAMIGAPQVVHVPYKGTAPAIVDTIAGRLTYIFDGMGPLGEHIRSGKLIGIAIAEKERAPQFPNIPSMSEIGLTEFLDYAWAPWIGIYAPKGTSPAIVERINGELNRANRDPEFVKKLAELGFTPMTATVAESRAEVVRQSTMWAPLIKKLNIRAGD